jgi:hypothetical protein
MEEQALIQAINSETGMGLPAHISFNEIRLQLRAAINNLIRNDFQQLVHILYRVDVNERKLKFLLQENVGEDAAVIIADLIITRQMEKITSRQQFSQRNDEMNDEEKWS